MRVRPGAAIPLCLLLAACRGAEAPAPSAAPTPPAEASVSANASPSGRERVAPASPAAEAVPPEDSSRLRPWRAARPSVSADLERAVERALSEALLRVERALAAPAEGAGRSRRTRVAESLGRMRLAPQVRVLVLDGGGEHVFPVPAPVRHAFEDRDVHGRATYRELCGEAAHQGLARRFVEVSADGAEGRASVIAWTRLEDPPWLVCAEGHERRERDGLGR